MNMAGTMCQMTLRGDLGALFSLSSALARTLMGLLLSVEMHTSSFDEFGYPDGSYWVGATNAKAEQ